MDDWPHNHRAPADRRTGRRAIQGGPSMSPKNRRLRRGTALAAGALALAVAAPSAAQAAPSSPAYGATANGRVLTFSLENPLERELASDHRPGRRRHDRRHRRAAGQRRAVRRHEGRRGRRSRLRDQPCHGPGDARVRPRRARPHEPHGARHADRAQRQPVRRRLQPRRRRAADREQHGPEPARAAVGPHAAAREHPAFRR